MPAMRLAGGEAATLPYAGMTQVRFKGYFSAPITGHPQPGRRTCITRLRAYTRTPGACAIALRAAG